MLMKPIKHMHNLAQKFIVFIEKNRFYANFAMAFDIFITLIDTT